MIFPFGAWRPDLADLANPGVVDALNCVPLAAGIYGPWPALSVSSTALEARCRGVGSGSSPGGTTQFFAGDAAKLYRLVDGTWTDVSGTTYATATEEVWRFATYGSLLLATNFSDPVQAWTMGTSTAFADLTPSGTAAQKAPRARHLMVVKSFVVCGNLIDADGTLPGRVRWGPVDNPAGDWSDVANQAESRDLYSGGEIMGMVGGDVGTIFCRNSIWRMAYIGGPAVFQTDEIVTNKGCAASGSIASVGGLTFFLAADGFYQFDGRSVTPIGADKVDDWFLSNADSGKYARISAAVDPDRRLYVVSFSSAGGEPDSLLFYNWELGEWARAEQATQLLVQYFTPGTSMEGIGALYASLDDLDGTLDSRRWTGGALALGSFDADNKLANFTGSALPARIDTGEFQPFEGRRASFPVVTPLCDGTVTVAAAARDTQQGAAPSFGVAKSPYPGTGECAVEAEGRYVRFRTSISGAWTKAQGLDAVAWRRGRA